MNLMKLFKKYILPEEIDFFAELHEQTEITKGILEDLYLCLAENNRESCQAILNDEHQAEMIKERNMNDLGRSFITPVDREAIFRAITHLDWIVISVKHLVMETEAYDLVDLHEYAIILQQLKQCANTLSLGFAALQEKDISLIVEKAEAARKLAHKVTETYVNAMAKVAEGTNIHMMFKHKEILSQIKSIAKRFHVAANTLQDISMKLS